MSSQVAITMTWAEWKRIDAALDNTAAIAAVDGPPEVLARASSIREAGWRATADLDRPFWDRDEWPPPSSVQVTSIAVTLSVEDWRFVLQELRRWAEVESDRTELSERIEGSINDEGSSP